VLVHFPGSSLNPRFSEKTLNLLDFPNGPLNLEQTVAFEGIEGGTPPSFTVSLKNIDTQITSKSSKKDNKIILSLPRDGRYQVTYEAKGYNTRSEYFVVEEKKVADIPETINLFYPRYVQIRYQHTRNGQFTETSPPQTVLWSEAEATDHTICGDWYFKQTTLENKHPGIVITYHNWGKTNGHRASSIPFDKLLKAPKNGYRPTSDKLIHKGDTFLFKENVNDSDVFTKMEIVEISKSPIGK